MKYLPSETAVPDWKLDWKQIQPALDRARKSISSLKSSSLEVMRVSQLDSDILDKELIDILSEQLWSALSYFKTTFKEKYEPELLAVIQLVLFKYSLYDNSATYGAQLQNLKYRNERMHKGPCRSYRLSVLHVCSLPSSRIYRQRCTTDQVTKDWIWTIDDRRAICVDKTE
ncbi:unnamed protein product [Rhizopus microsporus]